MRSPQWGLLVLIFASAWYEAGDSDDHADDDDDDDIKCLIWERLVMKELMREKPTGDCQTKWWTCNDATLRKNYIFIGRRFYSTPFTGVESTSGNSVCPFVCLSVITSNYFPFPYSDSKLRRVTQPLPWYPMHYPPSKSPMLPPPPLPSQLVSPPSQLGPQWTVSSRRPF